MPTKEMALPFQQWQILRQQAETLLASKFLPPALNTPEKIIAVIQTGKEIGIGMMAAIQNIHVIQGKPTISPRLMLARAIATKELEDWKIERLNNPDRVRITLKRSTNLSPHIEEFGDTEAKALELLGKDNYVKQKWTMYKWRALSAALNFIFPDVLMGGIYTPEELGATVIVSDSDDLEIKAIENGMTPTDDKVQAALIKAKEIISGLGQIHAGNLEAMAEELKLLTLHKDNLGADAWIELDSLLSLANEKPGWIDRIYEKIMPTIRARLAKGEGDGDQK